MTQHRHFKALIRARMARTGERYATARRHLVASVTGVTLEPLTEFRANAKHAIAVAFAPDGRELFTGGFGGVATVRSTTDWSVAGELRGHEASVNAFAFTSDDARIVTVSTDKTVRIWDRATRRELARVGRHAKGVAALDALPDGTLVTGGYDGAVRRWSLDGEELASVKIGARAVALAAHPTTSSIAASAARPEVQVLDPEGTVAHRLAADDITSSIRWSPDGSSLVAGTCAGVHVWATQGWERVRTIPLDRADAAVVPVDLSPDGTLLAAGWAHHLGLWRADEDEPTAVVDGLPKGVYGIAFSPDGTTLAQCGADGIVRVWRIVRR